MCADPGQSMHDSGLNEVSAEVLHTLLLYLIQHSEQDLGLTRDAVEAFVGTIRQGVLVCSGVNGTLISYSSNVV